MCALAVKLNHRHPKPAAGNNVDGNSQGGKDFQVPSKSLDNNREFLPFHSDQGATDLIALLSVTAAPKAGESKWVSSLAIHNELLRQGRKVRHPLHREIWTYCQSNSRGHAKGTVESRNALVLLL